MDPLGLVFEVCVCACGGLCGCLIEGLDYELEGDRIDKDDL